MSPGRRACAARKTLKARTRGSEIDGTVCNTRSSLDGTKGVSWPAKQPSTGIQAMSRPTTTAAERRTRWRITVAAPAAGTQSFGVCPPAGTTRGEFLHGPPLQHLVCLLIGCAAPGLARATLLSQAPCRLTPSSRHGAWPLTHSLAQGIVGGVLLTPFGPFGEPGSGVSRYGKVSR